jgi:hypothetical protein
MIAENIEGSGRIPGSPMYAIAQKQGIKLVKSEQHLWKNEDGFQRRSFSGGGRPKSLSGRSSKRWKPDGKEAKNRDP